MSTLFAQYLAGYVGRGVEHRGRNVEKDPLWTLVEVQDLLDEWITLVWQNRPHDGLRDPLAPGRAFTPNEKYAALVEFAGYLPVSLSAEDYIELLPVKWQAIGASGVRIGRRTYDSAELAPVRGQPSGITGKKDRWEIHHDPYDVSRIWVRNHHQGGWIMLFWKHLHRAPMPFGELAWDHARRTLPGGTEEEIADATAALLQRAHRGPASSTCPAPSKRDRRVTARTRATSPPPSTQPLTPTAEDTELTAAEDDGPVAKVIPLGIFDPFAEAKKRW